MSKCWVLRKNQTAKNQTAKKSGGSPKKAILFFVIREYQTWGAFISVIEALIKWNFNQHFNNWYNKNLNILPCS